MIGTRQWISKVEATLSGGIASANSNIPYILKILSQGKKISQIIAYIWLDQDHEVAQKLDGYFKRGDNQELKDLLFAHNPETNEYKLLRNVFQEKHLPIFHIDDEPFLQFKIVTNKFEGELSDPEPSDDSILTLTIPYPPRPKISDDFNESGSPKPIDEYTTIKKSELKEWLNQNPEEKPFFYENNPYIPTSSS